MRRLMLILLLVVLVPTLVAAQCDGNVHAGTYYVDNSCSTNGNGASVVCGGGGPFNSIANMQAKSGGYAAGNYVCLKRGQTYRESLTLPSSGTSASPIVLSAYGVGEKPTIKASDLFTSWTRVSGTIFRATAASSVSFLWKDGVFQNEGVSATELNNHEWFWSGGILYYREDENDLGSRIVEGAVRSSGIVSNAKSNWKIANVRIMHGNSTPSGYGFSFQGGSGFDLSDCEVSQGRALYASSTSSVVVNRCVFKYSYGDSYWPQFWGDGSSSVTVNNTIFRGSTPGQPSFQLSGSATAGIYNSVFDEYGGSAVLSSSSGTCTIQNSVFTGAVSGWANATLVRNGSGAVTVDYSLLLPYGRDGQVFLAGVTEGAHNLYVAPRFRSSVAKGYLIIGSDDTGWYRYFDEASRTADQYGYKIGFATEASGLANIPDAPTYIQDAINRGHWVASHSNSHADISVLAGVTLQYLGSGTAATMSIASNRLTTKVTGAPSDNLNLDLTNSSYQSLNSLCNFLAGSTNNKYTCLDVDWRNSNTASTSLKDISEVDIKSAPFATVLDEGRYLSYEVDGAHNIITSLLKNPDGTPYSLDTFVYPYGQSVSTGAVSRLQSLHYLGARSTFDWLANLGWRTSVGLDLYAMLTSTGMNALGELGYLWYNNNCADMSDARRDFNCSNISFSSTVLPAISQPGSYSAVFNGTSAYARLSDPTIDFHRGDGYWSAHIQPNVLTKKQVLFYQGDDASNYHTLHLSSSGTVVYSLVASGVETVHAETAGGLLASGVWQRVTLTFNQSTYKIFVGSVERASVSSTARPAHYIGAFTVGAGGNPTLQDYYGGYMSGMSFGTNTFASATAFLNTLGAHGGVLFLYGHGDPGLPVPLLRVLFQAKKASSANVMLDTYHNVLADLRSNGILASDNRTLTWQQQDGSDYHLLPDSPLINAGWADGAPPLDANGNPRSGLTDIGIYEYINRLRRSRSYWW